MEKKDSSLGASLGSSQNETAKEPGVPLSETIPNANAAGDGSLERGKETLLTPEEENKEAKKDEGIYKEGGQNY